MKYPVLRYLQKLAAEQAKGPPVGGQPRRSVFGEFAAQLGDAAVRGGIRGVGQGVRESLLPGKTPGQKPPAGSPAPAAAPVVPRPTVASTLMKPVLESATDILGKSVGNAMGNAGQNAATGAAQAGLDALANQALGAYIPKMLSRATTGMDPSVVQAFQKDVLPQSDYLSYVTPGGAGGQGYQLNHPRYQQFLRDSLANTPAEDPERQGRLKTALYWSMKEQQKQALNKGTPGPDGVSRVSPQTDPEDTPEMQALQKDILGNSRYVQSIQGPLMQAFSRKSAAWSSPAAIALRDKFSKGAFKLGYVFDEDMMDRISGASPEGQSLALRWASDRAAGKPLNLSWKDMQTVAGDPALREVGMKLFGQWAGKDPMRIAGIGLLGALAAGGILYGTHALLDTLDSDGDGEPEGDASPGAAQARTARASQIQEIAGAQGPDAIMNDFYRKFPGMKTYG